jgi:hypothetical protein
MSIRNSSVYACVRSTFSALFGDERLDIVAPTALTPHRFSEVDMFAVAPASAFSIGHSAANIAARATG